MRRETYLLVPPVEEWLPYRRFAARAVEPERVHKRPESCDSDHCARDGQQLSNLIRLYISERHKRAANESTGPNVDALEGQPQCKV